MNGYLIKRHIEKLIALSVSLLLYSSSSAQTMMADKVAYYPRVVRSQDNGVLIASFDNHNTGAFYESRDSGKTWTSISNLTENTPPRNCCSELYEVPKQLNKLSTGTLLWATSVETRCAII